MIKWDVVENCDYSLDPADGLMNEFFVGPLERMSKLYPGCPSRFVMGMALDEYEFFRGTYAAFFLVNTLEFWSDPRAADARAWARGRKTALLEQVEEFFSVAPDLGAFDSYRMNDYAGQGLNLSSYGYLPDGSLELHFDYECDGEVDRDFCVVGLDDVDMSFCEGLPLLFVSLRNGLLSTLDRLSDGIASVLGDPVSPVDSGLDVDGFIPSFGTVTLSVGPLFVGSLHGYSRLLLDDSVCGELNLEAVPLSGLYALCVGLRKRIVQLENKTDKS